MGIAGVTNEIDTEEAVLIAADRALYEAKHRGRNRTVLFTPHMLKTKQLEESRAIRPASTANSC